MGNQEDINEKDKMLTSVFESSSKKSQVHHLCLFAFSPVYNQGNGQNITIVTEQHLVNGLRVVTSKKHHNGKSNKQYMQKK